MGRMRLMLTALFIVVVLLVAGCSTKDSNYYRNSPPPSGGGCGVAAPAESVPSVVSGAVSAIAQESSL